MKAGAPEVSEKGVMERDVKNERGETMNHRMLQFKPPGEETDNLPTRVRREKGKLQRLSIKLRKSYG